MIAAKPNTGTFSILGFDPELQEWGIAIQSKLLAIGAFSPFAAANVGTVVTQAFINPTYGQLGLNYLRAGYSSHETLDKLLKHDQDAPLRQIGIMDAKGKSAVFTGKLCPEYAGSIQGENYAIQGNLLAEPQVLKQMAQVFTKTTGSLAERLLLALDAGQRAGGDRRGKQSAALLVVKQGAGYYGMGDRFIDLRIDDHPAPHTELRRLYRLHRLYFSSSDSDAVVAITKERQATLIKILAQENLLASQQSYTPEEIYQALVQFHRRENLVSRLQSRGFIDKEVYAFMLNLSAKV